MNTRITHHLSKLFRPLVSGAILIIIATPPIVSAQDSVLEEIIVTATRREQTIQDIPINISAMTGEQLESAGVFDLADLSRTIPGVAYSDLGVRSNGVNNQLIFRGLNLNAQGSIAAFIPNLNPAGVSTYMDNTPLFTNLRIHDLERVEVLRGPQGTLYGAGSLGGTVRFIFNKPDTEKFSAKINTGFSSIEDADDLNYHVDGIVNIPLAPTAALRVSAGYEKTAGFIDASSLAIGGFENPQLADPTNPFGSPLATEAREDTDEADQWYLRASLLWDISERIQAQVTYMHQDDDADDFSWQTNADVAGARERTHDQFFTSPLSREVDMVSLDLAIDFDFARLESATSYTKNDASNEGELSGLAQLIDIFAGGFAFGGFPAFNPGLSSYYIDINETKSVVQELRLTSKGESKFDWIVGFYYENIEFNTAPSMIFVPGFAEYANTPGHPFTALFGLPPFLSFADLVSGPPGFVTQAGIQSELQDNFNRFVDVEDIALFGELTYNITDAWQVTAGVRVFWNDFSQDKTSTAPLFGAISADDGMDPTGLSQVSSTADSQDEIFKVNTSYEFSDDLMVYFTWAEGFRRGGANAIQITGFNPEDPSLLVYEPDTVTNYEVGIKGVLFDNLRYTAAIYRVDWDKAQIATGALPSGDAAVYNAEEARTQGVELEATWRVTETLQLSAGYTYTDAELTADYAVPLGVGDFQPDSFGSDGSPLPGVPESMATWALDYELPVNFLGESYVHFRVDGSYRSSVVTAAEPTATTFAELDGFDMWNASLTWSNDKWRVGAYVKNIGDESGITQVTRDFVLPKPQNALDYVSRPRTVGVIVGYTY